LIHASSLLDAFNTFLLVDLYFRWSYSNSFIDSEAGIAKQLSEGSLYRENLL